MLGGGGCGSVLSNEVQGETQPNMDTGNDTIAA